MLKRSIGSRYARALFALMKDGGTLDAAEKDVPEVVRIIEGEEDLKSFLSHPGIGKPDKKDVLDKLFKGKVDNAVFDFLNLLVDKHREEYLPIIKEEFDELLLEHQGRRICKVTSAFELSADIRKLIVEGLSKTTGKKIEIEEIVDLSLIGGIKVQIGDKVFDGSLKSGLENMREVLLSAKV